MHRNNQTDDVGLKIKHWRESELVDITEEGMTRSQLTCDTGLCNISFLQHYAAVIVSENWDR